MSLVCFPIMYCKAGKADEVASLLPIGDSLNQKNTLAYYFFALQKSPNTLVGIELYTDKNGLKEHGTAPSFKTFSKAAGSLFEKNFTLEQSTPVCGFLSKPEEESQSIQTDRSALAVFVSVTCSSAEHRTRYLEEAAKYVKQVIKEPGTLSYYWCADNKDPTKFFVFERYQDMSAAKVHSGAAKEFVRQTKDLVKSASIEVGRPVGGFLKKSEDSSGLQATFRGSLPPLPESSRVDQGNPPGPSSFTFARDGVPQSIAHRGYKSLFPENTLIALEGALKVGADGIETDVQISRDDVVVISHDPTTTRCYGRPGNVNDQDFHGPSGMSSFLTVDEPHTSMPTLVEVLHLMTLPEYRDRWLLLDIKINNSLRILEHIAKALAKVRPDLSFWSSRLVLGIWHHKYLPYASKNLPGIPITHIGLHTSYARSHFLYRADVQSFNLQLFSLVTASQQAFIRDAHKLGKSVFVWTVNDADSMRYCMSLKVDCILSDDPSKTQAVQTENITEWVSRRTYWTWKRTMRSYMWNAILYLLMLHRIFWRYREGSNSGKQAIKSMN